MNKRNDDAIISKRNKAWRARHNSAKLITNITRDKKGNPINDTIVESLSGGRNNPEMYAKTTSERNATNTAKSSYKAAMRTYGGKATKKKIQTAVSGMQNKIGAKLNFS